MNRGEMAVVCVHCGGLFPRTQHRRGPKPIYCSSNCRREANKAMNAERRRMASDKRCEYCGERMSVYQELRGQRFCGVKCAGHARANLKGTIRECVICGGDFEPYYESQVCCNSECGSYWAGQNRSKPPLITIECERCGKEVVTHEYTGAIQPKLCEACYRAKERDRKRVRRARKAKLPAEEINEHDVYRRDKWICQICGQPIDPDCEWPDSQSPSIDHVKPISLGGHHVMSNVQAAHLGCNCSKGSHYEGPETETYGAQASFWNR